MRMQRRRLSQLYIMRAYHIYDEVSAPRMRHLEAEAQNCFIVYGRRDDGKGKRPADRPTVCALSHGQPGETFVAGAQLYYTIDTGMGHRCVDYEFEVLGVVEYDAKGQRSKVSGIVPDANDKINAYVFK